VVFGTQLRKRGERCRDLDDRCRIEPDIAIQIGINCSAVQGFDQKTLRVEAKASESKAVEVICSRNRNDASRMNVRIWGGWCSSVLRLNRPEQQKNQRRSR